MKLALIGYGEMGKLVERLATARDHSVDLIVDEMHAADSIADLAGRLKDTDVAIDFSVANAVRRNVEACVTAGIPLVEGTTGWNQEKNEIEKIVREANGVFVFGANFSVGINLFYQIVDFAFSDLISKFPEYEAFIEEQHHSRKKDAPSGPQ